MSLFTIILFLKYEFPLPKQKYTNIILNMHFPTHAVFKSLQLLLWLYKTSLVSEQKVDEQEFWIWVSFVYFGHPLTLDWCTFFIRSQLKYASGCGSFLLYWRPLVAIDCCLLFGRVVVSLTHSPFPFSILLVCQRQYCLFLNKFIGNLQDLNCK